MGNEPLNLRMDTGHSLYRFPFYNSFKNFHQHQAGMYSYFSHILPYTYTLPDMRA